MNAGTLEGGGEYPLLSPSKTTYCVAGLPGLPIQNVSVRAASGASRLSVVWTVAPSGPRAIAASAADTCGLIWYVEPCHRLASGNWNANTHAAATIIAGP